MPSLFLLKHRSELSYVVSIIDNEIFTNFENRIKIIRSDYKQVDPFCVAHGIVHETSCVHTSQCC